MVAVLPFLFHPAVDTDNFYCDTKLSSCCHSSVSVPIFPRCIIIINYNKLFIISEVLFRLLSKRIFVRNSTNRNKFDFCKCTILIYTSVVSHEN